VDELAALGASEVTVADLGQTEDVRRAAAKARAVVHICPNFHPDEVAMGRRVIAAAAEVGVDRFVLHSVLHPQAERMPHHWKKLRVEEALIESGLEFTILQPTAYMQNLLAGWNRIVQEGLLRNPYPVESRISLVDLQDVGEAAAIVLTRPEHAAATYQLVGTPPLAQTEVAAILRDALGRPVRAEAESLSDWDARALASGLGQEQRAMLRAMFDYYGRHGLRGNPNTLRWLLGREPTSLEAFARRSHPAAQPGIRPKT